MKAALVISDRDNVATALELLVAGRDVELMGHHIVVSEAIVPGHKFALTAIPAGGSIVKYGSRIGTASRDIPAGAHVHVHNVTSDRGRGDLVGDGLARLAEPDALVPANPQG
ncbi:MAG: UxaA family hydrolase [Acidobacteriota bacterium]